MFTPGPWMATKDGEGYPLVRADGDVKKPIASMWLNGDNPEGNARLIAAAPEMLGALKLVIALYEEAGVSPELRQQGWINVDLPWVKQARAAIAKATDGS